MHKQEIVLSEPLMSLDPATDLDEPNAKMDLNEGNLSNKISKYNEELTKEMHKQEIVLSEPLMSLDPATDLDEPNAKMDLNEGNLSNKISKYNEELTKEMHKQEIVLSEPLMSLDPGKWVFPLSGSQRHDLVQNGPQQMLDTCDENYPLDNNKRHFSNFHYTRKLSNGETQHRRWLVYSQSQDKIYCFPCTVFSNLQTQMIREGCCDWKHLSTILQRHEKSKEHMVCMIKWVEFDKRIKLGKTIDQENEKRIRESQKHWYNLFEKLINVINFLASHNLSFRGHRESMKLDDSNNSGNFIDLLKLLSKYDHSLQNHFQLINEKQLAQHYLSHDIQNELIKLMSKKVIEEIISKVKLVKYYAFMLDCTRDISRVEQMSIILRFCNTSTGDIEEHFIGFIAVDSTTGEHLTNIILHELKSNGLDIQDCRGQGFDNGANMVGINKGVKTRILNINPKAFFAPCGCHSWNLILVDAAKSSITATTFFGFIQKIYLLFSKSSKRWDLIKDKLKLTLKSLSETRWESRIAAVKAILFQFDDIIDCINILKMQIVDAETLCDCEAILKEMLTFEFIVAIHVWYEILLRVNNIKYRDIGFNKSIIESRQFIEKSSYEIELNFKNKRIAKKKKMFSYEHTDEPIENGEKKFRVDFFNSMIDGILHDIKWRFKSLNEYFEYFGFIYDMNILRSISKEDLYKHCCDLGTVLQEGEKSDIQSFELYEELQLIISSLPDFIKDAKQLIKYIIENNLQEIYPNVYITVRIMLTIPVSTASAERSFSKLKIIKNYLRNTMTQERLSALAVLSIETKIANNLNYEDILKTFSEAKSRKVHFL
ncbi:uncharacterized protein LOC132938028 [Metopolophium dirhodum]|uniref:uncharacterized protein LOC132938028 n=1 Tax=Metopolophium dirhodum TaxID=44670 RepID=UPI00299046B2|nr:uncharacterized protein LOC132938028 [Metopolophium dirhodum]